mmetsp:Transcript_107640/g.304489  ORF Transcript_107640/g.304489 Transcript_107640/m.304489 type:complete len:250 (-) Transcript_107640:106-855(-)|eukprot:CAMPEP_0168464724 /NCGR_PEP_ID=MMETSP0228-20121227/55729_1 /TAXON_ID=133427 /ORGANISM="Protoceratium reticulatum, Strain CCCM 535 (=CCMP 1889)" /LENGTH=249 /DNA_ID=CAMNT_0008480241 /DNA_START=175 /DNA_END=924 /DNA_ORIENTATION=+
MKPAWDQLMTEFQDSSTVLVADIDCTAGGEALCKAQKVRGYPTIRWGDPDSLVDYNGGRSLEAMLAFAKENLGPTCGPANLDLCSETQRQEIESLLPLDVADLRGKIEAQEAMRKTAEKEAQDTFTAEIKVINKQREELLKQRDERLAAARKDGVAAMKAVIATKTQEQAAAPTKRMTTTPRPPRTAADRAVAKLKGFARPLREDIEHILELRKNAAILLVVASALVGALAGRLLCPRRASVSAKKKDS